MTDPLSGRCGAQRHGSRRAYRESGCRCPEVVESVRESWRRRRTPGNPSHTKSRSPHVDEVAVERAMAGDRVGLTVRERAAAIARMTAAGRSAAQIAEVLGICYRTVTRYRSGQVKCAQPVDIPCGQIEPDDDMEGWAA